MDANSTEAQFRAASVEVEPTGPVLRLRFSAAERLLSYLRRTDATRVYTSWGRKRTR